MFNWDRMLTGNKVRRTIRALAPEDTDADTFEKEFTRLYEADTSRPRKEKELTNEEIAAVETYLTDGDETALANLYKSPKGRLDLIRRVRESGELS